MRPLTDGAVAFLVELDGISFRASLAHWHISNPTHFTRFLAQKVVRIFVEGGDVPVKTGVSVSQAKAGSGAFEAACGLVGARESASPSGQGTTSMVTSR